MPGIPEWQARRGRGGCETQLCSSSVDMLLKTGQGAWEGARGNVQSFRVRPQVG